MKTHYLALFTLVTLMANASPVDATPAAKVSPTDIERRIESEGASKVLWSLFSTPTWEELNREVEKASPEWLEVADKLLPEADAGASEELEIGVGLALARDPKTVLAKVQYLKADPALESVCESLPIEGSDAELKKMLDAREKALKSLSEPGLSKQRDLCLRAVAKARKDLDEQDEE
jgi:hypothetical protein